jgi:hypothetical protein
MQEELSQLVRMRRAPGAKGATLALIDTCIELCFRAEIANDHPLQVLKTEELAAFGLLMAQVHAALMQRPQQARLPDSSGGRPAPA